MDPYNYYDLNYVDDDVDTVGGETGDHMPPFLNDEEGKDGRYYDANGKEIDIGLAHGNGGMVSTVQPGNSTITLIEGY